MRPCCRPTGRILAAALAAMLLQAPPTVAARQSDELVPHAQERSVNVLCGPLPFVSDGEGCDSGIGADLARMACAAASLDCRFQQMPWPRAQKEIEAGTADILIGPFYAPERAVWMVFSHDFFYVDQMWLFRKAALAESDRDGADIRRVGVPLGWSIGGDLYQRESLTVEQVRTVDLALNLAVNGRLDAVAAHARAVARFQTARPDARFLPVGPPLSIQQSFMGFSRPFAAMSQRRAFEAAYDQLLRGPLYPGLLARYTPMPGMRTEVASRSHLFNANMGSK